MCGEYMLDNPYLAALRENRARMQSHAEWLHYAFNDIKNIIESGAWTSTRATEVQPGSTDFPLLRVPSGACWSRRPRFVHAQQTTSLPSHGRRTHHTPEVPLVTREIGGSRFRPCSLNGNSS